jgi:hypothetical protein
MDTHLTENSEISEGTQDYFHGNLLFHVSLAMMIGFLGVEFCYCVLGLQNYAFFNLLNKPNPQGQIMAPIAKRLEIVLFYGCLFLGAGTYLLVPRRQSGANQANMGLQQAFWVTLLVFLWSQISGKSFDLPVMNVCILFVIGLITLPSILGRAAFLRLPKWFEARLNFILLATTTAAVAALCTEPQKDKFWLPILFGLVAVILWWLIDKVTQNQLESPWTKSLKKFGPGVIVAASFVLSIPCHPVVDEGNQSCLLGPIMQEIHGNSAFVDYNPHYGFANGIALAPVFYWLGGVSFDKGYYVGFGMCFLSYIFIYLFSIYWLRSYFLASISLLFTVAFQVWSLLPMYYGYYSMGPYRFALPMLLAALAFFRYKKGETRLLQFFELMVVGLSSVWSCETAVFVLVPYIAILIYERRFVRNLPWAILSIAFFWSIFELRIWLNSGKFGDPRQFFESVWMEAVVGISANGIELVGTWIPIWILMFFSSTLLLIKFIKNERDIVLFAFMAVAFVCTSYFVNHSVDGVFLALAPIYLWLFFQLSFNFFSSKMRTYVLSFSFAIFGYFMQGGVTGDSVGVARSVAGNFAVLVNNLNASAESKSLTPWLGDGFGSYCQVPEIKAAVSLVKRYAGDVDAPIYALSINGPPSLDFVTSMCLNRPNGFNINPTESTFWSKLDQALKLSLAQNIQLKPGQVIFVDIELIHNDNPSISDLYSKKMLNIFDLRFGLKYLETAGRLVALQVTR